MSFRKGINVELPEFKEIDIDSLKSGDAVALAVPLYTSGGYGSSFLSDIFKFDKVVSVTPKRTYITFEKAGRVKVQSVSMYQPNSAMASYTTEVFRRRKLLNGIYAYYLGFISSNSLLTYSRRELLEIVSKMPKRSLKKSSRSSVLSLIWQKLIK